ncbi:MAG: stage III sporulation protein AD [Firmicutes bacterium]|nr:stage III sporulation protein AD [Bacillota bacterium]
MEGSVLLALAAVAVISSLITVFLKDSKLAALSVLAALAAGGVLFLKLLPYFGVLLQEFGDIALLSGVDSYYLSLMLKIIGVAYVGEFAGQLCRDAGQNALAMKIELAAKAAILLLALPIIAGVVQSVMEVLS